MLVGLWVFLPQLLVAFLPESMSRATFAANLPGLVFDGAAALLTVRQLTGAAVSAKEAQSAGMKAFGKLWVVGLLSGLGIVLGILLLIVPGVILIVGWMPATAVLMAEDKTGQDCLKRAWALTKGSRWRLAGLFGLFFVATLIVLALFIGLVVAVSMANQMASSILRDFLLGPVFVTLVSVVSVVGASAVYVSLTKTEQGVAGDVSSVFS